MTSDSQPTGLASHTHGSGEPVIVIHGFTGSAEAMAPLVQRLDGYRRIAVDLVGHGRSPAPADLTPYSIEAMADSLADRAAAAHEGACHIVGYSFGGRVALALAAAHPQVCRSLTLISATAGIADEAARAQRRSADAALAEMIAVRGLTAFIHHWTALPMWDSLRASLSDDDWQASIRQRLQSNPVGLANSLRAAGTGAMTPLWDQLADLDAPTLLLCGELDAKFVAIARDMAGRMPRSELVVVGGAGHAVHLEHSDTCARAVRRHLAAH